MNKHIIQIKALMLGVCLTVLLTASVYAQSGDEPNNTRKRTSTNYGGFGYFMLGYQLLDLSSMKDALTNKGYPEMAGGSMMIGGGGHYLIKNFLIGGEGFGLPGSRVENDAYIVSYAGGYGFFDLGYLLVNTPSFFLYPVVGIGGGGLSVNLKEKAQQTTSFPQIVDDPGRETTLDTGGFMLNFSLLANYLVAGERNAGYSGGFVVGLKAGYILNLNGNNWYQNQEQLVDAPASAFSGPYVTLVLGGGSLISK